ncbi:MAG: cyclase family protein, partial [Gaiellales bacterium]
MDASRLPALLELTSTSRVFDLAQAFEPGMSTSPNHPKYLHVLQRRHGDRIGAGGGSSASDLIQLGGHVGTHIDALAHVSQDGLLYGGVDAAEAQRGGRLEAHGVETIDPIVCRGVVLDVPRTLGVDLLQGGYEITAADLERSLELQGV